MVQEHIFDTQPFTEKSMIAQLLDKMANARAVNNGKTGTPAELEAWRQIREISKEPIGGAAITKSGPED